MDSEFEDSPRKRVEAGRPAKRRGGLLHLLKLLFLFFIASFLALIVFSLSPLGDETRSTAVRIADRFAPEPKIVTERVEIEKQVIVEKEVEVQPPLPSSYVPWKQIDVADLHNGIKVESKLDTIQGGSATALRGNKDSYLAAFKLGLMVPEATTDFAVLAQTNQHLPQILPTLGDLVANGSVSNFWHKMYTNKVRKIQQNITRLDKTLSRHNYYDCETILELTAPNTGRRVLLIQSEMDVVSDGSDGDRMPTMPDSIVNSSHYQAMTSYGWAKRTRTPNPLLKAWQDRLEAATERYKVVGLSNSENRELEYILDYAPRAIADLKARSFLIAETDPFIVISVAMLGYQGKESHAPQMGDYAVVIHEDKIFPCIVGDAGPSTKLGEASLFLAKAINPSATPYKRPVSDLSVTYLVFPGSRDKTRKPPDLVAWRERCGELVAEIGGLGAGYQLHEWKDPFATE